MELVKPRPNDVRANYYINEIDRIFEYYRINELIDTFNDLCKKGNHEDYVNLVLSLMEDPNDPTREKVAVFYGYLYANWKTISDEKKKCLNDCFVLHQESAIKNWDFMVANGIVAGDVKINPLNWDEPAT